MAISRIVIRTSSVVCNVSLFQLIHWQMLNSYYKTSGPQAFTLEFDRTQQSQQHLSDATAINSWSIHVQLSKENKRTSDIVSMNVLMTWLLLSFQFSLSCCHAPLTCEIINVIIVVIIMLTKSCFSAQPLWLKTVMTLIVLSVRPSVCLSLCL